MFVNLTDLKQTNLLTVGDGNSFADLINIADMNAEFNLFCSINKELAKQVNATKITVSIKKNTNPVPGTIAASIEGGVINSQKLIDNAVMQYKKSVDEMDKANVNVAIQSVAVSQVVNANTVSKKLSFEQNSAISLETMKQLYDVAPSKQAFIDLINDGIDPSTIVQMNHYSSTAQHNISGLTTTIKSSNLNKKQTDLLNMMLNGVFTNSNTFLNQTFDIVNDIDGEFEFNVLLPTYLGNCTVVFTVYDNRSTQLKKVERQLNISSFIENYLVPKTAPIVKKKSVSNGTFLNIKQTSNVATGVLIFRKNVTSLENYELIDNIKLTALNDINYKIDEIRSNTMIYRVVSYGPDERYISSTYTNVVALKNLQKNYLSSILSFNIFQSDNSVKFSLSGLSKSKYQIAGIQLFRRNLTFKETEYTSITEIEPIDGDLYEKISLVEKYGYVYEYYPRIFFKNGTKYDFITKVIDLIEPNPDKIDTKISNFVIIDQGDLELNVQFDVISNYVDNSIQNLKNLLTDNGVYDLYATLFDEQKIQLSDVIAHHIQRVNNTTGDVEYLGIIDNGKFDDIAQSKKSSAKSLNSEHSYTYEIFTLLKSAETLFETNIKLQTDTISNKKFIFNVPKYRNSETLKSGCVYTLQGLDLKIGKDHFNYGIIGEPIVQTVDFKRTTATITQQSVVRAETDLNIITWEVVGDIKTIDHFIIMKCNDVTKTIIDVVHSGFIGNSCFYQHKLHPKYDTGEFQYFIRPVFNTYDIGAPTYTDKVTI